MDVASYAYVFLHKLVLATESLAMITLCLLIARGLGTAFEFISAIPATRRALVSICRGRQESVCNAPILPPFHPDVPAELERPNDSFFRWMMWLVDELLAPAAKAIASAGLAFVVSKLKRTFSMQNIKARVAPLRTRLKRGIAQVATLQDAFTSRSTAFGIPYRYLCSASCLLGLFVGLVFVVGTPVGITAWSCSGGLLLVVVGDFGALKPQEYESKDQGKDEEGGDGTPLDVGISTTGMASPAPSAALQAQL
ncbi:hypothetical protein BDV93DRAFT_553290 [Ceratobasidium sp. AG-I]|nr:hypothetical protein BDV93DRAFT_553290 [Ceratobasidium sp. AG-I]